MDAGLAEGPRPRLQFETGTNGRLRLSVRSGAVQTGEIFDRSDAFTPSHAEMAAFAGVYRSEEMDAVYRIVLEEEANRGKTIIEKFDGGPVGVDTLAAATSEEADTIIVPGWADDLRPPSPELI